MNTKIMNKQERYNKIVKRLPILRDIKKEFWDIVYEPQEGDMPNHFDNLPKAERVAIKGKTTLILLQIKYKRFI